MFKPLIVWAFLVALTVLAPAAHATTLRWATAGDTQTLDPHAQNDAITQQIANHMHDALVDRNADLTFAPGLAESWQLVNDRTWRFKIRRGVKFHDGTPLTVEDILFSIRRAQHPNSNIRVYALALGNPRKVDDQTIELVQEAPNPSLLQHLSTLWIMSRPWAERNNVLNPLSFKDGEQSFATLNVNGTGPFILKSRSPGIETVMVANTNYWKKLDGNLAVIVHRPITNAATRVAALASGEIDLIQDPPPQDVQRIGANRNLKILQGVENRSIFVGMDQFRDELLYSNLKGANPFRDQRVREAMQLAIDSVALRDKVMRGLSRPTGGLVPAESASPKALEAVRPMDLARAQRLMREAGYPMGFEVTLDCTNNRYVNDGGICQALASMWAKIGIKVRVNLMPQANFWPKLEKFDTSLFLMGWGGASTDPQTLLDPVLHSHDGKGRGDYNYGRFSDVNVDQLAAETRHDMNEKRRSENFARALERVRERVYLIPLHRQVIPWAMRRNVETVHRADNVMPGWWTRVN
jgi:peptide/nickel transport system substrate-binding protein